MNALVGRLVKTMIRNKMLVIIGLMLSGLLLADGIRLDDIYDISRIEAAGDYLLVDDLKNGRLYVFSKQGEKIVCFGRPGQGPGELASLNSWQLTAENIVLSDGEKCLVYTLDGALESEIRLPRFINDLQQAGAGWLGTEMHFHEKKSANLLFFYNHDFSSKKQLAAFPFPSPLDAKMEIVEHCQRHVYLADRIIWADTRRGFHFSVFSSAGEESANLELRDYPRVKFDRGWRERKIAELKSNEVIATGWEMIEKKLVFPEFLPAFIDFAVSEGGLFLVRTYFSRDGQSLFFLLDSRGKKMGEVFLPEAIKFSEGRRHFCLDDHEIFYLLEDEAGDFKIFRYEMPGRAGE